MRSTTAIFLIFISILIIIALSTNASGPFHGQVGVAIEQAFGTGNPEVLKQYLPDDGKIFVSIPIVDVAAGNYSRKQLIAVLKQVFERAVTRGFYLEGGNLPNFERGPIRAIWKFTPRNSTQITKTTLYFTITSNPLKPIIKSIRGEAVKSN